MGSRALHQERRTHRLRTRLLAAPRFRRTLGFNDIMRLSQFIYLTLVPLPGACRRGGDSSSVRASQHHRAASRRLRHQPRPHGRWLRRVERQGPHGFRGHRSAPATATRCASAWSSTSATRRAISASWISASPPSNRATATSTPSTRARTLNEEVVETVEGEARRNAAAIEVSLKQPTEKKVDARQRRAFSEPAHAGDHRRGASPTGMFISADIYEGAGTGDASDAAAAAIGDAIAFERRQPAPERRSPLADFGRLFRADQEARGGLGEELPSYQMSFTLYENGVTNDLVMDYGDYALVRLAADDRAAEQPDLRHAERFPPGDFGAKVSPSASPSRPKRPRILSIARSALARFSASPSSRSCRSAWLAAAMSATPMPISRKRVPSSSLTRRFRPTR